VKVKSDERADLQINLEDSNSSSINRKWSIHYSVAQNNLFMSHCLWTCVANDNELFEDPLRICT
jgi:hypothetical protein